MLGRRRNIDTDTDTDTYGDRREVVVQHGPSLAKGPALAVGTLLVAFGLTGLLTDNSFPSASASFPDATANGASWLGFEVNGWTCFFCITAGALLLFGAAQHHLAKAMSVLVGLALAACAICAVIDGEDVLGLAAANVWTKIGWAATAVVLLLGALMPRARHERTVLRDDAAPATTSTTDGDDLRRGDADVHRRGRFGRARDRDRETVVAHEERDRS